MDEQTVRLVQSSYDRVAAEYARRIYDELQHKPLDRELLTRLAARVRGRGRVCDMGCGPGHVARFLHAQGAHVVGVDLSPAMVALARQLNPDLDFRQGNMLALDVPNGAWAGIVAFYSLIHIPRAEVVSALRELRRVLQPEGVLLLGFHVGDEVRHLDEWWGQPVNVDFLFFTLDEMRGYLHEAGFSVEEVVERAPYDGVEAQTQRAYVWARRLTLLSSPMSSAHDIRAARRTWPQTFRAPPQV